MHNERPSRDETFLRIAYIIQLRSTCKRRQVGAVITDSEGLTILGIGYNGPARGLPNDDCLAEKPGECGCIHAEANALIKSLGTLPDKVLYTTCAPCLTCARLILNAGIARVVYSAGYRTSLGIDLLRAQGIELLYR